MGDYLFDAPQVKALTIQGEDKLYPIHRIFCVGRNYAAHAAEMGNVADYEAPFYFTKQLHAVAESGSIQPYPPGTSNYHYEMELAFTIGAQAHQVDRAQAQAAIYSYGCALDMTRRDLQSASKNKRRPWDTAKDVEGSAVFSTQTKAKEFTVSDQRIHLSLNDDVKQDAKLSDMIHDCAAIVADLSKYYHLAPGDVILTGTPAGVSAVQAGDMLQGGIEGLAPISLKISSAE